MASSALLQVAFPEMPPGVGHPGESLGAGQTGDDVGVGSNDSVIKICNDNDSRPIDIDDDSMLPSRFRLIQPVGKRAKRFCVKSTLFVTSMREMV